MNVKFHAKKLASKDREEHAAAAFTQFTQGGEWRKGVVYKWNRGIAA